MLSWRRIIFGTPKVPTGIAEESDRFLSLIEVRSAQGISLLVATAMLLLWGLELHSGVVAPHDQIGLPAIALTMLLLCWRLW
jgi:hypothetical protein